MSYYKLYVKTAKGRKVIKEQGHMGCLNWTKSPDRYSKWASEKVLSIIADPRTILDDEIIIKGKLQKNLISGKLLMDMLLRMRWFQPYMKLNDTSLILPEGMPFRLWLWVYSAYRDCWTYPDIRKSILQNYYDFGFTPEMSWVMGQTHNYIKEEECFKRKFVSTGEHCLPEKGQPKGFQKAIDNMLKIIVNDPPASEEKRLESVFSLISNGTFKKQVSPDLYWKIGTPPTKEMEEWFGC